jgi:hypothetical protein
MSMRFKCTASLAAATAALTSASAVDVQTVLPKVLSHEIGPPLSMTTMPINDLREMSAA